jgi:predicted helicase
MAKRHDAQHMSVVFSTYHSIDVISQAQHDHGLAGFDLIVCDEAHRTTGVTFADDDESAFVRVHDADYIRAAKRLYMTATPRIYADSAKATAERDSVALCSMDDEALYGKQLYLITFSEAVERELLVDYKVIVLAVEESHVNRRLQKLLASEDNQLKVDDASKIVGCWKALAKQGMTDYLVGDDGPMRKAVAFCQVIEVSKGAKTHKVSSKNIANMFQAVVEAYQEAEDIEPAARLMCEAKHVDGGMNASEKEAKLDWLKADAPEATCRVLSNVRCLSEGVDVPALDAVLFLTPRNSQVDVVQSVGRVMRKAEGKKRGYVILPVVIPAGVEPHDALNDNKTYAVVWQVLQALRSHDDRFDAMVNKLDLIGKDPRKMEVIAITDKVQRKPAHAKAGTSNGKAGRGQFGIGETAPQYGEKGTAPLPFEIGEIERAIYAKVVQKCGNRHHWEDWANDIARIARTHIDRITAIIEDPGHAEERKAFEAFAEELRDDLNDSISDGEIIEMLAQHLITKPVFDALFAGYSFAQHNPMSQAMQGVLDALQEHRLDKEADTLERFYDSVRQRAEGIDNAAGKQKIVVELYDKFFRNAFPRMTERLGIVYTPVEVVDFILHSVAHLLQSEFGQTLGSKGVHILDPFTGTGTFITRLLQSGLITPEQLPHKYQHEIHANEIVLLAYYIAAINIEAVYHGIAGGEYQPFEGICLTDTFQMYEKDDLVDALLVDNSARRKRQKKLDIRVIVGNPPYSVGQRDDNDVAANVQYPGLDARLQATYVARSTGNPRSLYDSYIRAIRWASDRIGSAGVIGYVTNAGYVDGKAADGLRKCLVEEFSSLYVLHLRGNQRTSGDTSRREGGKIFGSGSRAPIAILLLVKNPKAAEHGRIYFHDIGDYLTREEKLERIASFASISGVASWQEVSPDTHGDWVKKRDDGFEKFVPLGDKAKLSAVTVFETYSSGVKTNRDSWAYNASRARVASNMRSMIVSYNEAVAGRAAFDVNDPAKIAWSWVLRGRHGKGQFGEFKAAAIAKAIYRPFVKTWMYYDQFFNENRYQMPRLFPDSGDGNIAIVVKQAWEGNGFPALVVNQVVDVQSAGGTQCFPLYIYDEAEKEAATGLFSGQPTTGSCRRDGITDACLGHFLLAYPGEAISKEDIFYYVYGLLHSPDYRARYADNLAKELPRVPCVKTAADFWAFSSAGRALAELHLGYETVALHPVKIDSGGKHLTDADYRVEKMRYGKQGKEKDLTTLHYNDTITLTGIPPEAYDYVVNGKPALDWVVERQCVKTDKASGIVNDANDWAIETMGNPKYPLELFQRVITISLETLKIVKALPALEIREGG